MDLVVPDFILFSIASRNFTLPIFLFTSDVKNSFASVPGERITGVDYLQSGFGFRYCTRLPVLYYGGLYWCFWRKDEGVDSNAVFFHGIVHL